MTPRTEIAQDGHGGQRAPAGELAYLAPDLGDDPRHLVRYGAVQRALGVVSSQAAAGPS